MLHTFPAFQLPTSLVARGGGGGSGGGGGGGGGSIIILIGYLPTHFLGALMRRKLKNIIGLLITAVATATYGILWFLFGAHGAGGWGIIIGLAAFVGGPAGYFGWFGKISGRVRKQAELNLKQAAQNDPAWNEATLTQTVQNTFMTFQRDWSNFNVNSINSYLSPSYANHIQLMLAAIKLRGRRNAVDNPKLVECFPTEVDNLPDNTQDSVTYYIHAQATDRLIETVDGVDRQLFVDNSPFYEYWRFVRSGSTWLLDNISQLTQNNFLLRPQIQAFAQSNGLYYSPDWGWLLLPSRGQLFKGGKFGKSDVNNHVIGQYHNLLVELYTYIPVLAANNRDSSQYLIAQVALPKRYDSLIVAAKAPGLGNLFARTPRGYNKISLEWPDFNKRYNVYATNVEQVTAFELLQPVYMEKLFALPFRVSIEVVDNVVYLYSKDKKADYPTMYAILQDAFKEMRL